MLILPQQNSISAFSKIIFDQTYLVMLNESNNVGKWWEYCIVESLIVSENGDLTCRTVFFKPDTGSDMFVATS